MKTEYKKVSELLALEDAEVLKEFEMVELQGGKNFPVSVMNSNNMNCTQVNASKCVVQCQIGNGCQL